MRVLVESSSSSSADPADDEEEAPSSGRRFGTLWLAAAVVVGLALGLVAGLLVVPGLTRPGDDSAEAGFARDMSTHHAQAVEMAMLAHQKGNDPAIRTVGGDIALTQHGQIARMQSWLRQWKLNPTGSQPRMAWMPEGAASLENGLMPGMATEAELTRLRTVTGREFDILFLQLMLKHHLGGIHMAEGVLEQTDNDEVRTLAQSMVDGQRGEVAMFQDLLKQLGTA